MTKTNKGKCNNNKSNIIGKQEQQQQQQQQTLPFVSVCTPTFNRRPFIENMIACFNSQDYPKDRMEWIIVDDGTDPIEDLVGGHPNVKYFKYAKKMSLGKKRNTMHDKSKGDIIVYMDDDDYYPPDRVSHAVDMLTKHQTALCAGSSEMYIYFNDRKRMVQFGPYGKDHATAGTFAFKRQLLKQTRYNEDACLAEEREFLKGYTIPFVQLDPLKTILVFSHSHNTMDKRILLDNIEIVGHPDSQYAKYSSKTLGDFIKDDKVIKFFTEDLEDKLAAYAPGDIKLKPDVLKQIGEIEEKKKQMMKSMQAQQDAQIQQQIQQQQSHLRIVVDEGGKGKRELSIPEVVELLEKQYKQLDQFKSLKDLYGNAIKENQRLKLLIDEQQALLDEKNLVIRQLENKVDESSEVVVISNA
jgi:glycosyltransferase involved in cell wall biosynthesis